MQLGLKRVTFLLGLSLLLLVACNNDDRAPTNNPGLDVAASGQEPAPAIPAPPGPEPGPEPGPALGAAQPAAEMSVFDQLELRATAQHTGHLIPAHINADVTGLIIATLLDGPLTATPRPKAESPSATASGLGALTMLPPFLHSRRRASWPELAGDNEPEFTCEQGSLISTLEEAAPQAFLKLHFSDCTAGTLEVNGVLLIERPANALKVPVRIGYDSVRLTQYGQTRLLTGTITWVGGDDCGLRERRIMRLHSSEPDSGSSLLLDTLESYTTAPPLFFECGNHLSANGWRGTIALGAHGAISIDTPDALSHDWDSLPRQTSGDIVFGANIAPTGSVRLRGDTSDLNAAHATLAIGASNTDFPDSSDSIVVRAELIDNSFIGPSFFATLADTRAGALSRLTDRDQDQIPDAWELIHGLDPQDASDAGLDLDGDGSDNLTEYRALRNPADAGDAQDGLTE